VGQRASTSTATEVLGGLVERVTFHNEENGFCILRVKARGQRDLITVLGQAAIAVRRPLGRRLRFVPGSCSSARTFASRLPSDLASRR
jgi:hypothetical protein